MFERLLKNIGQPANQHDSKAQHDAELQLASAILLFAILPVDYEITGDETSALQQALRRLFNYSPEKCQRMIARAAAARDKDPSIVAATTLLKRNTTEHFRRSLLTEIHAIIHADGVLHDNEIDLEQRITKLLGLDAVPLQKSA